MLGKLLPNVQGNLLYFGIIIYACVIGSMLMKALVVRVQEGQMQEKLKADIESLPESARSGPKGQYL